MSNKIVLSNQQLYEMQKLLDEGKSMIYIGKIFNISQPVVSRIIREHGLQRTIANTEILRLHLSGYQELEKQICDYYISHKTTLEEVGKLFGLGVTCIEQVLIRNNIDRLKSSDFIRKYTIDEDYFLDINSDTKAYILGFIYADGNIGGSNYKMSISLQEDDKDILVKMNQAFKSDRPLMYREPPKKYPNRKPQYTLVVENKKFCQNLMKHGVNPRKSYNATFPIQISNKFYKSFIRGIFDGDGCITQSKRGDCHISFTGTNELMNSIGDIIENELKIKKHIYLAQNSKVIDKNTRVLSFGGNRQTKRFLDWVYNDADIFLDRKYKRYCDYFNINNSSLD